MHYEIDFLKALALTITIETVVLFVLIKVFYTKFQIKNWVILISGITASFATLPYLWFILPIFIKSKIYYSLVAELTAVILESFILLGFLRVNYKNALLISIICNSISYITGLILTYQTHWFR
jgi:hypothetical protein